MQLRILLTNDDGIAAAGLHALFVALKEAGHNVTVAAPAFENSAISHAITVRDPIFVDEYEIGGHGNIGWSIGGHPADCVKLALEVLLSEPPEIVVSGINNGPNTGLDTIYSGTVSAAMEACMHNVPAIAFSLDSKSRKADYTVAAEIALNIVGEYGKFALPAGTMLNVNIPAAGKEHIKGMRVTELGNTAYDNVFSPRRDLRGRTYYWLGGSLTVDSKREIDLNKDTEAVSDGWVTLTPLKYDLTDYAALAAMKIAAKGKNI
ncbi:MAG: 5'/3'-nucleotidase SurE [Acidaminococcales bacterium]|jgi:5'-nucleotidase|nr:5'/3'-nucleotidase SurE [Acidaminococcales bacterium]